jgi:hypothetical protein
LIKIKCFEDFEYSCKNVTVTFFLDINGNVFPNEQWTDFAIIVLSWWTKEVIENYQLEHVDFILYFMDGPYRIECSKSGTSLQMNFVEDKKAAVNKYTAVQSIDSFALELIEVSTILIKSVKKRRFSKINELRNLKKSLKVLMSLVNSF